MLTQAAQIYSAMAPTSSDWLAIVPETALGVWALFILLRDAFRCKKCGEKPTLTVPFFILVILYTLSQTISMAPGYVSYAFGGMMELSRTTGIMRAFFLLCGMLTCMLGSVVLKKQNLPRTEFEALVAIGTAGLMFLCGCRNFALLFVALETMSISMYALVAYARNSNNSLEAAIKYIIQSGVGSALLLLGIVFIYGAAGNQSLPGACNDPFSFGQLREFIGLNPDNLYVLAGASMVLAGLLFKIAAVPFQIWVCDVYQGAPTPVTAYLGVASKAAGFVMLINILKEPFAPLVGMTLPLLTICAILTIIFGNFAALGQTNVKRLMGLSGISHAGYMLMGVCAACAGVQWAVTAVYFYLFVYLLASFTIFGVMSIMSGEDDSIQTIGDYAGLMKKDSFLGGILTIALGSLAGIPPMAGFAAKLLLFIAAIKAGLYGLVGVALLGVVLSIYYYFGWIRQAVFVPYNGSDETTATSPSTDNGLNVATFWMRTMLTTLALMTIGLGFWQGFLCL
jgi:NADH-quinone oxidoreductase subunit N